MSKNYKYRKWFTFEGRQYSVRGDTLDEVYEKKAKKLQELKETGRIVSGDTLLKDWAIQCIETYKVNQKEITRQKYISRIRHCILEEIGDLPLKKIKPLQCQQVLNAQAGKSKTQINEVYQMLQFIIRIFCLFTRESLLDCRVELFLRKSASGVCSVCALVIPTSKVCICVNFSHVYASMLRLTAFKARVANKKDGSDKSRLVNVYWFVFLIDQKAFYDSRYTRYRLYGRIAYGKHGFATYDFLQIFHQFLNQLFPVFFVFIAHSFS